MVQMIKATKSVSDKNLVREWKLIDLKGQVLGRAANEIATLLQGKDKVTYIHNLDLGDNVVVINAKKVVVTGKKAQDKEYTQYSGYPGGLRTISYAKMMENNPTEVIRHAISGMLPKNKLRDRRLARLFIYADDRHPYNSKFNK